MLNTPLKNKNKSIATFLAFAIIPISGLATDIYLPSMPQMALDFNISETKIQLTLTLFLISYGLGQFLAGGIVDAFGRYKVSSISLLLFIFSFILTAQTENIYIIYAMRILQGLLSALIAVSKRTYFVDLFHGEKLQNYLSSVTIVWSLAPIIAPFIGGYLQDHFGWTANFYFLALYCTALLLLDLLFSGETITHKKTFSTKYLYQELHMMLKTSDFLYILLLCGVSFASVMFYNLSGPFIIEHKFGYSSITIGYISLVMGVAWMLGSFISRSLLKKPFIQKISYANMIQFILILGLAAVSYQASNIYSLVIFAFLIHITAGFIFNNCFLYCLSRFPKSAGISSGLTGGMSYIVTSCISYAAVAFIKPQSQLYIALGYFAIAVIAFFIISIQKTVNTNLKMANSK